MLHWVSINVVVLKSVSESKISFCDKFHDHVAATASTRALLRQVSGVLKLCVNRTSEKRWVSQI